MDDLTPYQRSVIRRYYNNLSVVKRQRLAELVSEIYLAQGKARARAWKHAAAALKQLGFPPSRIDHIVAQDDPKLLAEIVTQLQGGS